MFEGAKLAEIPATESFYDLSTAADRLIEEASKSIVFVIDKLMFDACHATQDVDLPTVADACRALINEKYSEIISGEIKRAMEWLESEPAFAMAYKSLGYQMVAAEYWAEPIRRELERWVPTLGYENHASASYIAVKIARIPCHYLKYVSRIALASHRYISGVGHRTVIEGPTTIRRLKALIAEFEDVISTEWLPESLRRDLAYSIRTKSALQCLEECNDIASPASRRNDPDLPTRLFATDLLRVHQQTFNSFHKKTVFHLMGLSFVDRPLEMRTIERLAKSELEHHREIAAKRIADKRGLDFDHVLATLKANKSFNFPRENKA